MLYLTTKPEAKKLYHNNDLLHAVNTAHMLPQNPILSWVSVCIESSRPIKRQQYKKQKLKSLKTSIYLHLPLSVVTSLNIWIHPSHETYGGHMWHDNHIR